MRPRPLLSWPERGEERPYRVAVAQTCFHAK